MPCAASVVAGISSATKIWGFVYAKEGNVPRAKAAPEAAGDVWTFTPLDSASKLIVSYVVGPRDGQTALGFMDDLRSRIEDRPQISTDGLKAYVEAVDGTFGGDVDFAQVIKEYGNADDGDRSAKARHSPGQCTSIEKKAVWGNPDMEKANTSYVERNNLAIRMSVRRFTRLTNAFSKKLQNHCVMLSLYFYCSNWVRPHAGSSRRASRRGRQRRRQGSPSSGTPPTTSSK